MRQALHTPKPCHPFGLILVLGPGYVLDSAVHWVQEAQCVMVLVDSASLVEWEALKH